MLNKDTERQLIDQYKQNYKVRPSVRKTISAASGWNVIWILGKRQPQ